jgi:hypothetical protein
MDFVTVKFDEVFANETFFCNGVEYQRANCGPYDKKRRACCENSGEWYTFRANDRVQVWRY